MAWQWSVAPCAAALGPFRLCTHRVGTMLISFAVVFASEQCSLPVDRLGRGTCDTGVPLSLFRFDGYHRCGGQAARAAS